MSNVVPPGTVFQTTDRDLPPRAQRRRRPPRTRIDYPATAAKAAGLRAQNIEPAGQGAQAALCHERRENRRRSRQRAAKAARKQNR